MDAPAQELLALADRLAEPGVTEILINGTRSLVTLRSHGPASLEPSPFRDEQVLTRTLQNFAAAHAARLDPLCPAAGGSLEHVGAGESLKLRWHAVIAPVARGGALLSLRRHRLGRLGLDDFAAAPGDLAALAAAFAARRPIFICGATASGKTSLLAALCAAHAQAERVVILEQLAEMDLLSPCWVQLVARQANVEGVGAYSLAALVREALRLRPDRLIVGELRGEEAEAFGHALVSGHEGSLTTVHVHSPELLIQRLEQLSQGSRLRWGDVFAAMRPVVVMMARGNPPRLKRLVEYDQDGFRPLTLSSSACRT